MIYRVRGSKTAMKFRDFIESKGNYQQYLQRKGWGPYKPTKAGDDPITMAAYNIGQAYIQKIKQATGAANWQPMFPGKTIGQVLSSMRSEGARFKAEIPRKEAQRYSNNLLSAAIQQIRLGIQQNFKEAEKEYNQCQGNACPAILDKLQKWQKVASGLSWDRAAIEGKPIPTTNGVALQVFVPFKQ